MECVNSISNLNVLFNQLKSKMPSLILNELDPVSWLLISLDSRNTILLTIHQTCFQCIVPSYLELAIPFLGGGEYVTIIVPVSLQPTT